MAALETAFEDKGNMNIGFGDTRSFAHRTQTGIFGGTGAFEYTGKDKSTLVWIYFDKGRRRIGQSQPCKLPEDYPENCYWELSPINETSNGVPTLMKINSKGVAYQYIDEWTEIQLPQQTKANLTTVPQYEQKIMKKMIEIFRSRNFKKLLTFQQTNGICQFNTYGTYVGFWKISGIYKNRVKWSYYENKEGGNKQTKPTSTHIVILPNNINKLTWFWAVWPSTYIITPPVVLNNSFSIISKPG